MKKALYISSVLGLVCAAAIPAHAMGSQAVAVPAAQPLMLQVADDRVAGAVDFIKGMAQRGIDFLGNEKMSQAQRKDEFRKLLRASYDMRTIGRFALGQYWRTATKQQQDEYQQLFEKMIIDVYAARFSDYKGQQLNVTGGRADSDTDVIVNSRVISNKGGDPIDVDWRVRYNNGQYKVIDVIVAGVSMALTQRQDFASVIQQGGGDLNALLQHMRND